MIFINFKTYQQGTGEASLSLAKICLEVASQTGIKIIPIVQVADVWRLTNQGLDVWAQAVDAIEFGAHTGGILPEAVLAAGAKGILLNHSEKKLSLAEIEKILGKLNNCQTLVCTDSLSEGQTITNFKPTFLAYEPSELIGGEVSVSQARPEMIKEFIDSINEVPILVGAGVHTSQDVKKALELGARGVLVSSEVVLATDPKQALLNLTKGFK
ncbi:MAG: triose-phosphate isomerase [Candidatus Shapirobacteria bacterium]|nr:triose-phosphate isomerase [Candidatus Shapirobacteria bacterium]